MRSLEQYPNLACNLQQRRRLLEVAAFVGCFSLAAGGVAHSQAMPGSDPAMNRRVQAIPLQSPGPDGETSWLIEQDVPRIPKIAGFERNLPPHIDRRLSYAFDLAQRGATYTADTEFRSVLGLCALELDAREGGVSHREAMRQGWIAIDEADQFSGNQVDWRDAADVRTVAIGHVTPVLRGAQTPVDSIEAVQAYYAYAENRLAYACHGVPGATLAYYGLARTILVPGTAVSHAAGKAALLHRVALIVAPQNVLSANELGVLLAQHGQLDDAQSIFQQCVAIEASPETWRNLSVVYARQGNQVASRSALASAEQLAAKNERTAMADVNSQRRASHLSNDGEREKGGNRTGLISKLNFIPKLSNPFRR